MKNKNTFCRHEKKLLVDAASLPEIRRRLLQYTVPDRYCTNERDYEVCNLYFDTQTPI